MLQEVDASSTRRAALLETVTRREHSNKDNMKYTSIDHGSNSPLGNRVSSSQSNARSTTSSLTTRLAQWLVILALSLYLVLTQHSSRGTALTPVAPPPLRTADLEQSVEDPKYIIREPPGYLIGPPQVYLNATGLAYNLTIHETRLQNEQAQTQAVDGGPSYGLHIKSTLRVVSDGCVWCVVESGKLHIQHCH